MGLGRDFFEGKSSGEKMIGGPGDVPDSLASVIALRQQQRGQQQDSFLDSLAAKYTLCCFAAPACSPLGCWRGRLVSLVALCVYIQQQGRPLQVREAEKEGRVVEEEEEVAGAALLSWPVPPKRTRHLNLIIRH